MSSWNNIKPPFGTPPDPAWVKSSGCVGLWTMNERAGIKIFDGSGYNNTGTMTNMDNPSTATSGWAKGRGLSFDGGNDYVGVGTSTSLNITNAITISEWIKVGTGVSNFEPIFESVSGHTTLNRILIVNSGSFANKLSVQFDIGGNNNNWYTNNTIARNTWVHIVYTFNGSLEKIYINGVLDRQYSKSGTIATGTEAMKIGWSETENDYFNGFIDDVRIYNRALSANEVWKEYVTPYCMYPRKTTKYFIPPAQGIPIELLQSGNLMGVR